MKKAFNVYHVVISFLKNRLGKISTLWKKLSLIRKICFSAIFIAVIGGFVVLLSISSTMSLVPVINAPISDKALLNIIVLRISRERVKATVTSKGVVKVADETTARRMRAILIREDLLPSEIKPWQIFNSERWSITDLVRNTIFQRKQTKMITDHIKAISGIDDANVLITWPEEMLFRSEQKPATASVIITHKFVSDIIKNRKKIEGIKKTLKFAVQGLDDKNILIADQNGLIISINGQEFLDNGGENKSFPFNFIKERTPPLEYEDKSDFQVYDLLYRNHVFDIYKNNKEESSLEFKDMSNSYDQLDDRNIDKQY